MRRMKPNNLTESRLKIASWEASSRIGGVRGPAGDRRAPAVTRYGFRATPHQAVT
jgi:hypothetical protein